VCVCVRAAREWLLTCMRVLLVSATNKTLTHITVFLSVRSVHRTERVVNADNGDYLSLKHDDSLGPLESTYQMASLSVQPFFQGSLLWQTTLLRL